MSMFTLVISCLTTSNLPLFMDLTFPVPMQYCSSQHQILHSPRDTSTTKHCFCFGPPTLFFLEVLVIALCPFTVAFWKPSNLGGLSSGVSYLLSFHTVRGVLQARILEWVGHFLLQWTKFCQNTSLGPAHLGWSCMARLIVSMSCAFVQASSWWHSCDPWRYLYHLICYQFIVMCFICYCIL